MILDSGLLFGPPCTFSRLFQFHFAVRSFTRETHCLGYPELRTKARRNFENPHSSCSRAPVYRVSTVWQRAPSIPEGYEELASRASGLTVRICADAFRPSIAQLNN